MFNLFKKKKAARAIYPTFDKGFHGDDYLIDVTRFALERSRYFIETGSAEATTLRFVAKSYPDIQCFSCEPDPVAHAHATKQVKEFAHVDLRNEMSPDFLYKLVEEQPAIRQEENTFWLDAHGYGFKWPLREEVKFVLSNFPRCFMFIDDFKVPGEEQFGYDVYKSQKCSLEYLSKVLAQFEGFNVYFPRYTEVTSEYHPLRGWVLIEQGHGDIIGQAGFKHIFKYDTSLLRK